VQEHTPASELGLAALDMIKSINGKKVTNVEEIEQAIEEAGGADKITVEVLRAGQTVKLEHK
jgi:S1-C subfamily serine protease